MNCLVTAGPTFEPLDDVRRLTNFSTGTLGSELANHLVQSGHTVTLLLGEAATYGGTLRAHSIERFTTTTDLHDRLRRLPHPRFDAVFHAAAVSDFRFGRIWQPTAGGGLLEPPARKLPTREGALWAELLPTPKIIAELRGWFSRARLIGWKYEVAGSREEAVAKAAAQIVAGQTDGCVVNGRAYGSGYGLVTGDARCTHLADHNALFQTLAALLEG